MKKTKMMEPEEYADFGCQTVQGKAGAQNIDLAPKGQLVREYAGQIDRW